MSFILRKKTESAVKINVYSERGKLDLLYSDYLTDINNVSKFLDLCYNINKKPLSEYIEEFKELNLITEFDLGKSGFGSPDGCIVMDNGATIFIEGKNETFEHSFKNPGKKKFNSSINGQIELKWRFMNSYSKMKNNAIITENENLPMEYISSDVFYKKRFNKENHNFSDFRKIKNTDLIKSFKVLFEKSSIDNLFFIVATTDIHFPSGIKKIRLINPDNKQKNYLSKIFYFNIDEIFNLLNIECIGENNSL